MKWLSMISRRTESATVRSYSTTRWSEVRGGQVLLPCNARALQQSWQCPLLYPRVSRARAYLDGLCALGFDHHWCSTKQLRLAVEDGDQTVARSRHSTSMNLAIKWSNCCSPYNIDKHGSDTCDQCICGARDNSNPTYPETFLIEKIYILQTHQQAMPGLDILLYGRN